MFIFRVVTIAGIALLSACATNVSFDEAGERAAERAFERGFSTRNNR